MLSLLYKLFTAFFKIGAFSFGGGYAMIPLIQREIVSDHQWLNFTQFLEIIAVAEMTPGPVAINSATYVGYRVAGFLGSLFATSAVIMPSLVIILLMARLYQQYTSSPWLDAIMQGIRPAFIGLIFTALIVLGKAVLVEIKAIIIGLIAFLLLLGKKTNPITVIAVSACLGILLY